MKKLNFLKKFYKGPRATNGEGEKFARLNAEVLFNHKETYLIRKKRRGFIFSFVGASLSAIVAAFIYFPKEKESLAPSDERVASEDDLIAKTIANPEFEYFQEKHSQKGRMYLNLALLKDFEILRRWKG